MQSSEQSSELIERLVQPERPAVAAHLLARMREHHVTRWIARGSSDPLENEQAHGERPIPRQRQQRDRAHLDDVAGNGDGPELPRLVREPARDDAEPVAEPPAANARRRQRESPPVRFRCRATARERRHVRGGAGQAGDGRTAQGCTWRRPRTDPSARPNRRGPRAPPPARKQTSPTPLRR